MGCPICPYCETAGLAKGAGLTKNKAVSRLRQSSWKRSVSGMNFKSMMRTHLRRIHPRRFHPRYIYIIGGWVSTA